MEIVLLIFTAVSGALIIRFSVPGREEYGLLLLPSLAVAASSLLWLFSLLIGLSNTEGWIWLLSLVPTFIGLFVLAKALPPKRSADRAAKLENRLQAAL